MHEITIDGKKIGGKYPVYIIAELSANHGGDIEIAKESIRAASRAGADAVKIQTYTPDTITLDCDNEYFQIKNTIWDGQTLYQLYQSAYMPWEWQPELKKYAENIGITLFSTPFDRSSVDFLEEMNVPAYKISSFEIVDIPLIEYVASKNKPIILSAGIATVKDIEEAINACKNNKKIILMKCTSDQPSALENLNLKTITDMKKFDVVIGFSDHSGGIIAPVVAVSLGACVIEKHFTLDKSIGGPDVEFSADIGEFENMVKAIRDAEKAKGTVSYKTTTEKKFARSLFVVKNVEIGDIITTENVRSVRPGYGMRPKYITEILGKKFLKNINKGTPLSWNDVG